jgi:hypothetical protein
VHDQRVRLGLFGLAGNPSKRNTSENVHETGVSRSGQSGFPLVAAEAEQGSELEERPGHGPDRSFCALQGPEDDRLRMMDEAGGVEMFWPGDLWRLQRGAVYET